MANSLTFGRVTGRFLAIVADGPLDDDDNPDIVALTGSVLFTPSISAALNAGYPATLLAMPISADIDADGDISINGSKGIKLLATDDPSINPTGFTYTVSFASLRYNGSIVSYKPFSIRVPGGATVDLSVVAPVPASGGTATIPDSATAAQAVAAAQASASSAAGAQKALLDVQGIVESIPAGLAVDVHLQNPDGTFPDAGSPVKLYAGTVMPDPATLSGNVFFILTPPTS